VSFEEVVAFLFDEFGIEPLRDDHQQVLADSRKRFETFRTWPGGTPPSPSSDP
jgi:hypothetical protein